MFKEAGDFAAAEHHYSIAAGRMRDDPDLALQLGHFFKVSGRPSQAAGHYRRALSLKPGWNEPETALAGLDLSVAEAIVSDGADDGYTPSDDVVRELLPGRPYEPPPAMADVIEFRQLGGRRTSGHDGRLPVLSGVEAIRGVCLSRAAIVDVEVSIDDEPIHREPLRSSSTAVLGLAKYVFNVWLDLSGIPPGLHRVKVTLTDEAGHVRQRESHVIVAEPLLEAANPASDAVVNLDRDGPRSVSEQVRARPSIVRTSARSLIHLPVRSILVLRTDQLGDVVVSIPALRRLRILFPDARIVGLVTASNVDLAQTTDLFDELIVVDFPDDHAQRRRTMTRQRQLDLRERLARYQFDIALDLAISHMSRPLLQLSGAKFLYGFNDAEWPWLSAGLEGGTHDPKNHLEIAPQSGKILALVERLGTIMHSGATIVRRGDLDHRRIERFGLDRARPFVVLHAGARIAFSRWHGYGALVRRLIEASDLDVVLMGDDSTSGVPTPEASGSDRLRVIDQHLDFDDFDALLSHATAFVGNDSGPKHLAALRGTPVVSVHSARINWAEWGQEQTGLIVSRRVPCAGCAIYHDVEECGKGYACIADIGVDEVFAALASLIPDLCAA